MKLINFAFLNKKEQKRKGDYSKRKWNTSYINR